MAVLASNLNKRVASQYGSNLRSLLDRSDKRWRIAAEYYWHKACWFDNIEPSAKFAVFTANNPYAALREWFYQASFPGLAAEQLNQLSGQ